MKVKFKKSFLKSVTKLSDKQLKLSIIKIIEEVESTESINQINNIKKLKGYNDFYRLRIRHYRIGIKLIDNVLYFVAFAHRKDIYKKFP